jgi:hypothetical protein
MDAIGAKPLEANLYRLPKNSGHPPALVQGTISGLSHDKVEISPTARMLAEEDITHHEVRYYGNAQINDSLKRTLADQSQEVQEAVYGLIRSDLITDGQAGDEQERSALMEMGLSKAQYIADNYMSGGQAAEFMDTIKQIAAIATTRTVDPDTGAVSYAMPPERPIGAPDDYIKPSELMQRFEPETLKKLNDAVVNGKDWASILIDFVKRAKNEPKWAETFRQEAAAAADKLKNTVIGNRFGKASTEGLDTFAKDMQGIIGGTSFADKSFLSDSLTSFIKRLDNGK